MLKCTIENNTVSLTGLTFKQIALLDRLLLHAGDEGGYQIDINEYNAMNEAISTAGANKIFDLDKEKEIIEENIAKIMAKYN